MMTAHGSNPSVPRHHNREQHRLLLLKAKRFVISVRFELQLADLSQQALKRNPIYHFYETVTRNAEGKVGNSGDKHYKCYHGGRKVLTITSAMKSSLNGASKVPHSSVHIFMFVFQDWSVTSRPVRHLCTDFTSSSRTDPLGSR